MRRMNDARQSNIADRKLNYLLILYCILLPFEEALAGTLGSLVKIFGVILMVYCLVCFHEVIMHRENWLLIAWLMWGILSFLWADSFTWWLYFLRIYTAQVLFLVVVSGVRADRIDMGMLNLGLSLAAIISAVIIVLLPQKSAFTEDGRRTIMLFEHGLDPNIVSAIIMLGIVALLDFFFSINGKLKWITLLLALFCFLGVFYTGSRGGLMSTVVAVAILILCELKNRKNKRNRRLARCLIIIIVAAVVFAIPYLPANLLEGRFSSQTILGLNELNVGAHNRYSIWRSALELIPNRLFTGYGLGTFIQAITRVYIKPSASHNMYILLMVETGGVGLLLFLGFLLLLLWKTGKNRINAAYSMLVGTLFMCMSLDGLPYKFLWVTLLYAEIAINHTINIKELEY